MPPSPFGRGKVLILKSKGGVSVSQSHGMHDREPCQKRLLVEIRVMRWEMLRFPLPQESRSLLPVRGRLPGWLHSFALELRVKSWRLTASRAWVGQLASVTRIWGCAKGIFMTRVLRVNRALRDVLTYG